MSQTPMDKTRYHVLARISQINQAERDQWRRDREALKEARRTLLRVAYCVAGKAIDDLAPGRSVRARHVVTGRVGALLRIARAGSSSRAVGQRECQPQTGATLAQLEADGRLHRNGDGVAVMESSAEGVSE